MKTRNLLAAAVVVFSFPACLTFGQSTDATEAASVAAHAAEAASAAGDAASIAANAATNASNAANIATGASNAATDASEAANAASNASNATDIASNAADQAGTEAADAHAAAGLAKATEATDQTASGVIGLTQAGTVANSHASSGLAEATEASAQNPAGETETKAAPDTDSAQQMPDSTDNSGSAKTSQPTGLANAKLDANAKADAGLTKAQTGTDQSVKGTAKASELANAHAAQGLQTAESAGAAHSGS